MRSPLLFTTVDVIESACVYCCEVSFFFSSRRRHTRWPRDWSSDVCSSDLNRGLLSIVWVVPMSRSIVGSWANTICPRSEERRVGKECRSRGGREDEKEK